MRVTQDTGSTNLRYGKPWIARISDWQIGRKPTMEFGGWAGDESAGLLELDAEPGDVVRWCVKNYRDTHAWCIVDDDGSLRRVTEVEAREHWVQRKTHKTKRTVRLKITDKFTYERIAAHLSEWPLHPDEAYSDWDGWDKFLASNICMRCGEREPTQGRLCEGCYDDEKDGCGTK